MRINWKIVSGILAAGWTYDTIVSFRNKKRFHMVKDQKDAFRDLACLYGKELIRNEVPIDPFVRIAMNDIKDRIS